MRVALTSRFKPKYVPNVASEEWPIWIAAFVQRLSALSLVEGTADLRVALLSHFPSRLFNASSIWTAGREDKLCGNRKEKTPPKRGFDASKPVKLDAVHALLDEGTLLHQMISKVLL